MYDDIEALETVFYHYIYEDITYIIIYFALEKGHLYPDTNYIYSLHFYQLI